MKSTCTPTHVGLWSTYGWPLDPSVRGRADLTPYPFYPVPVPVPVPIPVPVPVPVGGLTRASLLRRARSIQQSAQRAGSVANSRRQSPRSSSSLSSSRCEPLARDDSSSIVIRLPPLSSQPRTSRRSSAVFALSAPHSASRAAREWREVAKRPNREGGLPTWHGDGNEV